VKGSLKQALQQRLRLRRDFSPHLLKLSPESTQQSASGELHFSPDLAAGWYMLEVVHDKALLGHSCALTLDNGSTSHCQMRTHAVAKRIVHVATAQARIHVQVDSAHSGIERVSFVRLSKSQAARRIYRHLRLPIATSKALVAQYYSAYEQSQHRHVQPPAYGDWLSLCANHLELGATSRKLNELQTNKRFTIELLPLSTAVDIAMLEAVFLSVQEWVDIKINVCLFPELERQLKSEKCRFPIEARLPKASGDGGVSGVQSIADADLPGGTPLPPMGELTDNESLHQQYTLLLGDCRLHPGFAEAVVAALTESPKLVFTDHDSCGQAGDRQNPVFKPEWNPELLLNRNYIGSTFLVGSAELNKWLVGQPLTPSTFAGDVLLAARTRLSASEVIRIPRPLISELVHSSTAQSDTAADWPQQVRATLTSQAPEAIVETGLHGTDARVRWPLDEHSVAVDIIIPTRDRADFLDVCVQSVLERTQYASLQITIIDNDSVQSVTHELLHRLSSHPRVNVMRFPGDFNFSAMNNSAVAKSTADVVLLLNNDTEVITADWLTEMVSHAMRSEVGCVGAKLLYSNTRVQHAGVVGGLMGVAGHVHRFKQRNDPGPNDCLITSRNVSAVTAACLAVRRSVYNEVGGLDAQNFTVALNDVDFCWRVGRAGYQNVWTPYVELFHHESVSRGDEGTAKKSQRFAEERSMLQQRWPSIIANDPAYHPSLSRDHEDGFMAMPIRMARG